MSARPVPLAVAEEADVTELAYVAASTFPLACPPSSTPDNVAAFIETQLSAARFTEYVADPDRLVLVARQDNRIVGYVMMIRDLPDDDDVRRAVTDLPTLELSKIYVLADSHGTGAAAALMGAAMDHARSQGARTVWLGVNQLNLRAQRFYAKHGFAITGTKSFQLGAEVENDYVMIRSL